MPNPGYCRAIILLELCSSHLKYKKLISYLLKKDNSPPFRTSHSNILTSLTHPVNVRLTSAFSPLTFLNKGENVLSKVL